MTVVPCPKCSESVSLPTGASPQAEVECPLCQESYELSEALAAAPPTLKVLNDPGAEELRLAPADQPAAISAPTGAAGGGPGININATVAPSTSASAVSGASGRRGAPGGKRKRKNPVIEMVKIVLGGIAGLVIAQLLLWWMPFQGLRRDPLMLAPKVSRYAPWIVPSQFREAGSTVDRSQPSGNSSAPGDSNTGNGGLPASGSGTTTGSGLPNRSDFIDLNQSNAPSKRPSSNSNRK